MPLKLSYHLVGNGQAQVQCICGWRDETFPVSPFDPLEALIAASVAHLACPPPQLEFKGG